MHCRKLSRVGVADQHEVVALYERMKSIMAESEDKKPAFLEVANLMW